MDKKLKIAIRESYKSADGYKVFSVRIREDVVDELDDIAKKTNRSRNELVNIFLEFCVENWELDENQDNLNKNL